MPAHYLVAGMARSYKFLRRIFFRFFSNFCDDSLTFKGRVRVGMGWFARNTPSPSQPSP